MSEIVHVANTNFEFELMRSPLLTLEQSWSQHPVCLQLQFLPLLYAQPHESVAVTALPSPDYLALLQQTGWWKEGLAQLVPLQTIAPFEAKHCLSWGPSR